MQTQKQRRQKGGNCGKDWNPCPTRQGTHSMEDAGWHHIFEHLLHLCLRSYRADNGPTSH
ncbi:hypothetical protein BLOT_006091 [Blomia tropicalis]|nr:hypothetical protein BLOT_006091 [Blomia tropicalis]